MGIVGDGKGVPNSRAKNDERGENPVREEKKGEKAWICWPATTSVVSGGLKQRRDWIGEGETRLVRRGKDAVVIFIEVAGPFRRPQLAVESSTRGGLPEGDGGPCTGVAEAKSSLGCRRYREAREKRWCDGRSGLVKERRCACGSDAHFIGELGWKKERNP
ncbi:hypothetical protein LR48_Vigan03g131600 [Vigna angularis]|uniref:Uncharacterized protein n=1 Tax=Phaseolus angularis TaxID=3914 RepID=A0A0L9U689_PHAAN|nr:hypothetical protein LR48_Vigan03g131600 [Vigna angularis]